MRKTTSLFLTFTFLLLSAKAQEWTKVYDYRDNNIFSSSSISQIQFIKPHVGYFSTYEITTGSAAGDAHLYKTTNHGKDWDKIYTQPGTIGSHASIKFDFLDEKNFFLFKSSDGALYHGSLFIDSTEVAYGFTPYPPPYVKVVSPYTILLSHYTDENYIFLLSPTNGSLNKIQITDDYVCWYPQSDERDIIGLVSFIEGFGTAVGKRNGLNLFYASNSSFSTWEKDTLKITGSINGLHFKNSNIGFIVCNDTILYRTHNSGLDWNEVTLPEKMQIKGIEFSDTLGYIISTNGRVATSTDDGITWEINSINGAGSIVKLTTVQDIAYVVDEDGQIFTNNTLLSTSPSGIVQEYIELFPNPVSSELYVKSSLIVQNCSVYNSLGILIKRYSQINSASFIVSLGEFSNGIYFLKFSFNDGFVTKKIIKN